MEILILAALITAFIAGIAALFAPCCIGVLLPAYFGSIFRQKRTVMLMTSVFFLGLLAVFLPIGLGMGFFGQLFKAYHNQLYLAAGGLMFLLGISILSGFHLSLPFRTKHQLKVTGAWSVFLLGIFSGFATLCCAPVLAGAMALSLLPGSTLLGGIYSVVYVFGMVVPLFALSFFVDKTGMIEKINVFKKEVSCSLFGKKIALTLTDFLSGLIFFVVSEYRFPAVPALAIYAGYGITLLFQKWKEYKIRELFYLAGFLAFFVFISNIDIYSGLFGYNSYKRSNLANSYFGMGVTYEEKGLTQEAIASYEKALEIMPQTGPLINMAGIYERRGNLDKAAELNAAALRIYPGSAEASNNLGAIMFKKGKYLEAAEYFTQALSVKPDFEQAKKNLAVALKAAGKK